MMKRKLTLIFIQISLVVFISCNQQSKENSRDPAAGLTDKDLNGTWQLKTFNRQNVDTEIDSIYRDKKPVIIFDTENNRISGNTSCNSFSGQCKVSGNHLDISDEIIMTKMACEGLGEAVFIEALKSIDGYMWLDSKSVWLLSGRNQVMVLHKQ